MKLLILIGYCLLGLAPLVKCSKVLELTDRFVELKKEGMWLVMFYAPWCGHCKRLDPVWGHVAQSLHNTNIRVGRVDCTRFTSVAHAFSVNGFPTIVFVKEDTSYVFKGDRTKEELLNFAIRLSGPAVQQITRSDSIEHLKGVNDIFFLYAGPYSGDIWNYYMSLAERQQANSYFYCSPHYVVQDYLGPLTKPTVAVFKESTSYIFEHDDHDDITVNESLSRWINEERFLSFPKVTKGNLHQFFQIKKNVAMVILEENKLEELSPEMIEFRELVEGIVIKYRSRYHKHFQFGWVGSPDLANSIAMTVLPLPHLLVVNTTTHHHYLPDNDPSQLTHHALVIFLESIINQSAPVLGGSSWWVNLFRMYFEGKTALSDMWRGNPVLTSVLFGLPMGFLSLICYSICCADIMDADDEEEDDIHEKRE